MTTYLSYKKGKPKNFPSTTPLYFGEAFVSGFGADAPTFNAHTKTRINARFLFFINSWNCVPNLASRNFL